MITARRQREAMHHGGTAARMWMTVTRGLATSACLAVATLAGTVGSAVAQQAVGAAATASGPERLAFDVADTDGDGLVSEAELARDAAVGFATLDRDGSMTLTPAELGPHDPARFAGVDANRDGALTFSEVMVNKTRVFEEGDKNEDDGLAFEEMVEVVKVEGGAAP